RTSSFRSSRYAVLSQQGERVAARGESEEALEVRDTASGSLIRTFTLDGRWSITEVSLSDDAKFLCWASRNEGAKVWNVSSGREIGTVSLGDAWRQRATFAPDGKGLLYQGEQGLALWDVATGKKLRIYGRERSRCHAYSPDGKRLVIAERGRL